MGEFARRGQGKEKRRDERGQDETRRDTMVDF